MVSNLQMWVLGGKEFVLACRNTQLFHRFTAVSCRFKVPFQGPRKIRAFLKVLSCAWNLNSGEKNKNFLSYSSKRDSYQGKEKPVVLLLLFFK